MDRWGPHLSLCPGGWARLRGTGSGPRCRDADHPKDERALATWLKAGALSDAADAASTLAAFRELGSVRRLFWAGTAAGTTALGLRLAGAVD